eukprot:gene4022-2876_t
MLYVKYVLLVHIPLSLTCLDPSIFFLLFLLFILLSHIWCITSLLVALAAFISPMHSADSSRDEYTSSMDRDTATNSDGASHRQSTENIPVPPAVPEYVNYLDMKIERIENLPSDWYDLADAPAYHQNPFRYEVSISTPLGVPIPEEEKKVDAARRGSAQRSRSAPRMSPKSTTPPPEDATPPGPPIHWMTFTHGRMLQNLPQYRRYVESAVAQAVPGMDEVNPIRDIPEAIDVPGASPDAMQSTQASAISRNSFLNTGMQSEAPPPPPPVLLWVTNEETDVPPPPAEDNSQKRGKRKPQQQSTVMEVAPPPNTPDKDAPPPCVFRIPLDIEQEAYLESLLNIGKPLNLTFKRVLKSGLPPEWEDLNAAYYEATIPVNVSAFAEPGSLKLTSVVPLEPKQLKATSNVDNGSKKKPRRAKLGQPASLIEEPDLNAVHPYVANNTTAVISLGLQRTLARLASDRVRPNVTPAQLIPSREDIGNKFGLPPDVTRDFADCIEEIARKIIRDFKDSSVDSTLKANATNEEKEAWRTRFLEFFQSTGQMDTYKAQIIPLMARVAQDKFLRGAGSSKETICELSNELYVYLLDCMHSMLLRVVNQESQLSNEKNSGVQNAPIPDAESMVSVWKIRAVEAEISKEYSLATKYHQARLSSYEGTEQYPNIWTDAAEFFVRAGDPSKAEQCYREAIACDPQYLPALLGYGMWLMSYQRLNEAAVFLHGVVDLSPEYALAWGCIALLDDLFLLNLKTGSPHFHAETAKWQKEQRYAMLKAMEFCANVTLHDPSDAALSGTGGRDRGQQESHGTSPEESALENSAQREVSFQTDVSQTNGTQRESMQDSTTSKMAQDAAESQEDRVYLQVADYAIHLQHRDLANLCLACCRAGRVEVQRLYARLFVQCEQYEDAIQILDALSTQISDNYDSLDLQEQMLVDEYLVLRAESEAGRGNTEEAIYFYKEALCKNLSSMPHYMTLLEDVESMSPNTSQELSPNRCEEDAARNRRLFFAQGYLELGNLLLSEGKVRDALGVFTLGIQCWNCGLMWLGAGIAYFRMGEYEAAEECLNESNIRNPLNPRTWAYLALLCIRTRREEVEEIVQRVMIQGLTDPALWAEIGRELQNAKRPQLSEVCLRKAILLEEAEHPAMRGKPVSALIAHSKYHLAHALVTMQRWEEARAVMRDVVAGTNNEVLKAKAEEELKDMRRD